MTNGDRLKAEADARGVPLRTLADVRATLTEAHKTGADKSMARVMLRHGRLTEDARAFVAREYPQD